MAHLDLSQCTPANLKNPIFATVLSAEDVPEQLLLDCLVSFAPGLLDAVQATTLPTIGFFKNLPTDFKGLWAVYVLVLEKAGCRPMIYIGSGTERDRGVALRLQGQAAAVCQTRFGRWLYNST